MKLALSLPLLALASCITADEPDTEAQVAEPLWSDCDTWGCGTNSPTVGDGLLFDELDASGAEPNRGGLRIVEARLGEGGGAAWGTLVKVSVVRHFLVADTLDGSTRYHDGQLRGLTVKLHHDIKGDYELKIAEVYPQSLYFWSGSFELVPSYAILSRKIDEPFKEYACRNVPLGIDPHWTGIEHNAIVFQGDRYNADAKTVTETSSTDPWFNIACAATAPAKMHLMRHTQAGSYNAWTGEWFWTSVKQRQAMLKMFTADYCGTGFSFTVDGQHLTYQDANHWYNEFDASYVSQEALWTSEGALCLDEPRRADINYVYAKCNRTLPSCQSFTAWPPWEWSAHVMSANVP
jgi:hypothetical protein